MDKAIISTKGTTKALVMSGLVSLGTGLVIFIGILCFVVNKINSYPSYVMNRVSGKLFGVVAILGVLLIVDMLIAAVPILKSKTYVEVFENHMEGMGMQQGLKLMNFKLSNEKITNVTCNGMDIYIHTNGGKYRVTSDVKTAKEVFDYYNK